MSSMSSPIRSMLSEFDAWLGCLANLQYPGYIDDPNIVIAGSGVYSAEDWTRVRKSGASTLGTDGTELDSNEKYLRYLFGPESMNAIAAMSLASAFDFGRYKSIFELGCGSMAQAFVINRLWPDIQYVTTDLDPFVISKCQGLTLLDGIEKRVLDVLSITESDIPFAGYDFLISWGMEYALTDHQLQKLFGLVSQARIPYLLCSATSVGLLKYVHHLLSASRQKALVNKGRLRLTGWQRSPRKLLSLGKSKGLVGTVIGRFGYHFCILFNK
jgi:hypothetical protein